MIKTIKWLSVLLLIAIILAIMVMNTEQIERWMYPIKFRDEIKQSAAAYNLNPNLVAAIIRSESNFEPHLVSDKGAVGLMQVMPETADWIAEKKGLQPPLLTQLHDESFNIEFGTWYMNWLLQQFKQNEAAMIAAYNAGPTNVRKWLNDGTWDGRLHTSSNIPFGETRHYVQRVAKYFATYEELYAW